MKYFQENKGVGIQHSNREDVTRKHMLSRQVDETSRVCAWASAADEVCPALAELAKHRGQSAGSRSSSELYSTQIQKHRKRHCLGKSSVMN